MWVTRLRLENWRNFTQVDVVLGRRVFLIGPNASGKSNLLDALRFLRDLCSSGGGLEKAATDRGGVSRIRCLAARKKPQIGLRVTLGTEAQPAEWTYLLRFTQDSQRCPRIAVERVERDGEVLLERPNEDDRRDPDRLRQTHIEGISTNECFREIHRFFRNIRYLHVLPPLIRQPERFARREVSDEAFGSDFLEQVARTTRRTRNARLRRIGAALKVAVPQLVELSLKRDKIGTPHLEGRYEHWRPHAARHREDQFSDGTLRLVALLWAAMDGRGPLLLEEPELNLHTAIVRLLPPLVHKATSETRRQIFMATHSPDLLSDEGVGGGETLLLQPGENGTRVSRAADDATIRALLAAGLPVGDAAVPATRPERPEKMLLPF